MQTPRAGRLLFAFAFTGRWRVEMVTVRDPERGEETFCRPQTVDSYDAVQRSKGLHSEDFQNFHPRTRKKPDAVTEVQIVRQQFRADHLGHPPPKV